MLATLVALHLGLSLLGQTQAQVWARLGVPPRVEHYPVRVDYRYSRIEVIFGDGSHASAVLELRPPEPAEVRRELARVASLRGSRPYHCDPRGCFGTFFSRDGRRRVIYGREHGRPYLGVQVWPQPKG